MNAFRLLALLLAVAAATVARAASVSVQVLSPDREPVPGVAVFVERPATRAVAASATMDQIDSRFVPHLLVVQKGTAVEFPNSDVVAHHVYSFSRPNNFVLPLYKGDPHAPIRFEHAGVVILGCNIHDDMLGYIVVVDSASFGVTDAAGRVSLQIDAGAADNVIRIWSPRIRDDEGTLRQRITTANGGVASVTFGLQKKLRPPHASQSSTVQWSDY